MDFAPKEERPRLLVVDDQPIIIQVLAGIFGDDYEVCFALSGEQAVAMALETLPDLILLDMRMPDMDGTEVCRALKRQPQTRDIPVIFVTAQTSGPEEETECLAAGAVDFITKPVNPTVVRARVDTHLALRAQSRRLRSMAFNDGLTGVANRRRFDEYLAIQWETCRRNGTSLALALADIDHFKRYNDTYGHQAGDACLRQVAETLAGQVARSVDLVARYGGEEFVCVLPGVAPADALRKAGEMVAAVSARGIPHSASPTDEVVTISLGVSCARPGADQQPADLIAAADKRLYAAKESGRNRACG